MNLRTVIAALSARNTMLNSKLLVSLLLLASGCASTPTRAELDSVAAELREMGRADRASRNAWLEAEKLESKSAHANEVRSHVVEVDRDNTRRLGQIVETIGWPRRTQVGDEAADAAWLIAQHTPDHAFQGRVLELLRPLLADGEVDKPSFALLEDRVRCDRGEPQLYGTQYLIKQVDGVVNFGPLAPIADAEHLDERRSAMGLEPHAEYVAALKKLYGVGDDAVVDP